MTSLPSRHPPAEHRLHVTSLPARLRHQAEATLMANWRGASTVPTSTLYPHQWSWDSAFIAIGLAHLNTGRAWSELVSLFRAQWTDGRVPQIVFNRSVPEDAYFPGPRFWRPLPAGGPPSGMATTGLVQPPVHAAAALAVARQSPRREARAVLRRLYPRLAGYHDYLHRRRSTGSGLVAIVHPWESGMDNSPAWDAPLNSIPTNVAGIAERRRDLVHAGSAHRPTHEDYARYIHIAEAYRDREYDDVDLAGLPFCVVDPLFNALLAWSERALAELAHLVGLPTEHHINRADALEAAVDAELYEPDLGCYVAVDVLTGRRGSVRTVGGLAPLLLNRLRDEHRAALVDTATGPAFRIGSGDVLGVPSYDLGAPDLDLNRYWRGPAWINTSWLVWRGLDHVGEHRLADGLAASMTTLVADAGFREYFDPLTGEGLGARDFSWSASLILDVLEHATRRPRHPRA
jgi:hypothetical protein